MNEKDKIITKYGRTKINNSGYLVISSSKEGNHMKLLHRLIYEEHHGKIPDGYDIHHVDGNSLNNDISNLVAIEKKLHYSLHNKGENNPMWDKHHSEETKRKIGEKSKERWKNDEYRNRMSKTIKELWEDDEYRKKMIENHPDVSGINHPLAKYTIWDISTIHYYKGVMFQGGREPNPCKCFYLKYKGYQVPIGGFHEFISVEIINDLVNDAIGE